MREQSHQLKKVIDSNGSSSRSASNVYRQKSAFLTDNRSSQSLQMKTTGLADHRPQSQGSLQLVSMNDGSNSNSKSAIQRVNNTGIPDNLKSGMENLSGHSLDHVRVHYNSPKPATVQAHAYAQGSNIHLSSGQDRHLPHELGHVVQQMQGRVKPTTSVNGLAVNDNVGLEKEADAMGAKAMRGGK